MPHLDFKHANALICFIFLTKITDHIKNILLRDREGQKVRFRVNNGKAHIKTEALQRVEEKLRYSGSVLKVNLKEFGD